MKVRQDAWSHEDDLMLAETVLRHVREGSTQLKAFDEVGDRLSRTSAAVGFRWNAIVRERYEQALKLAKKQRKEMKRAERRHPEYTKRESQKPVLQQAQPLSQPLLETPVHTIESPLTKKQLTMRDVITFLSNLEQSASSTNKLRTNLEKLESENQNLKEENTMLHQRIKTLENEQQVMKEDYQSLIQIMDRARRMVVLNDNEDQNVPTFKMDKNGNLEKVAR
ncbi:RsfA family transcriptional regulator [Bacillus sp. RAR_GA_16]|uniref:RsfA family transcriptional regulator n=1 Tax=Bacillus sp. RAR_GA_16 TaxID=2876774 RepID=UPI001CCF0371|nr:RsfA family transcriptional regulator [Bacillus sp. RAR_GA_16]MCA0171745.1 RsfA family transcriptional regulator [Bacillus sp. RAR_GA_16]